VTNPDQPQILHNIIIIDNRINIQEQLFIFMRLLIIGKGLLQPEGRFVPENGCKKLAYVTEFYNLQQVGQTSVLKGYLMGGFCGEGAYKLQVV